MSDSSNQDPRVAAIGTIAGCGVGALAVTLIFGRALGMVLPALAIVGTALAIIVVWRGGGAKPSREPSEVETLKKKREELEQRLADAEAVDAYEDRLAAKEAKLRVMGEAEGDEG